MFEIFTMLIRNMLLTGAYQNQVFKDPLSAEEETYYIEKLKNNDNHAREVLIEHNLRLVAHIVKKYSENKDEVDDLISIGTIGLIKGVDSFKESNGAKLTTYAARCIENAHLTLRNTLQYFKQHLMLYKVKFKQNTRFNLQILVEHYLK